MIPMFSVLRKILVPEGIPRRATRTGGFAIPVVHEEAVTLAQWPILVTSSSRTFLQSTGPSTFVRSGFSECPLEDEPALISGMCQALYHYGIKNGWANRHPDMQSATSAMSAMGLAPRKAVLPFESLAGILGDVEMSMNEVNQLHMSQGFVSKVVTPLGDVEVLVSQGIPPGQVLLSSIPTMTGKYYRSDDSVSLVIYQANASMMLADVD